MYNKQRPSFKKKKYVEANVNIIKHIINKDMLLKLQHGDIILSISNNL